MNLYIILVISTLIVLIIVGLVFWSRAKKNQKRNKILTTIIEIYPSGNSIVEFVPYEETSEFRLMKIALLYLIKIRYIIVGEPIEIYELYKNIIESIANLNEESELQIDSRIIDFLEEVRIQNDAPSATKNGEKFIVNLIEGLSIDYVDTKIPFRGLSANIPISVILLFEEVVSRLSSKNADFFEFYLKQLAFSLFQRREMTLVEMKKFNKIISSSFTQSAENMLNKNVA